MWPAGTDSLVRCLFERSSEGSVVPRLSDLEPGVGVGLGPLEASRPPWFGWRAESRGAVVGAWPRGQGGQGVNVGRV